LTRKGTAIGLRYAITIDPELLRRRDLTASEKLVLAVVETLGRGPSGFWMRVGELGESLGVDAGTARRTLRRLEQKGLIVRFDAGGRGAGSTARYRVVEAFSLEATQKGPDEGRQNARLIRGASCLPQAGALPGSGGQSARQDVEMSPEVRVLSLCFALSSERQRAALLNSARMAVRRGTPWPWLAWAIISRRSDMPVEPWKRVDLGEREAKAVARAASAAAGKSFVDLRHVLEFLEAEPDRLPDRLMVEGRFISTAGIVHMATIWPDTEDAEADSNSRPVGAGRDDEELAASQAQAPMGHGGKG
jgi:DNA-binding transcriptional ArsR family regulator